MKKIIITSLITAILTSGLVAGLLLVREKQEIREKAQTGAQIFVSLSPSQKTVAKDEKFIVSITLFNTNPPGGGDVSVYTAGVDLGFDSSAFSAATPSCNTGFLSSPAVAKVSGNAINLSCFAPGGSGAKTIAAGQEVTLGSFELTAVGSPGTSQVNFTRVNVPDANTSQDLSGGVGTGRSYTISSVGGGSPTSTPTSPPGGTNPPGGTSGGGATATPKPTFKATPKSTVKPKKSLTPTPRGSATPVVILPIESPTPFAFETFPPEAQGGGFDVARYLVLGGAGLVILGILIWTVKKLFGGGGNPPKINPPTGGSRGTQTVNMVPPVMPPTPPATPPSAL